MRPCRVLPPLSALVLAAVLAPAAHGQVPAGGIPGYSPRVSPYINLLTPGTPAAISYYGIVRPEFQIGASVNALRTQTLTNQQAIGGLQAAAGPLTTGHPVGFMTHLGYFQNLGGTGGGTAYATAAGTLARPANAATAPSQSRGPSRSGR